MGKKSNQNDSRNGLENFDISRIPPPNSVELRLSPDPPVVLIGAHEVVNFLKISHMALAKMRTLSLI
jgi:hypothetical protein